MISFIERVITTRWFRLTLTIVSVIFVVVTYFISLNPDSFLRFGYAGVLAYNVVSSGLLLIPTLVVKMNLLLLVFVSALGNAVNTSFSYVIGKSTPRVFQERKIVQKLMAFLKTYGLYGVYVLSVAPLPIDLNGMLSGHIGISYKKYILVNFLGKLTVFFLAAAGIIAVSKDM